MEEERKGRKLILVIVTIFLLIFLLFIYCKYMGVKGIITKEYRVESNILTENFSGIKIVHFSDLLYKSTIEIEDIDILIQKTNRLKPDLIIFTGDLIADNIKITNDEKEKLIDKLDSLKASLGKYAVKGENDYLLEDYDTIMNDSDFIVLNNEYDKIYKDNNEYIYIVGLSNDKKEAVDLETAFNFYSDEDRKYIITLVHNGSTISKIDKSTYEVDLILGGHSLGGSIVVPFYGPLILDEDCGNYYLPKYNKGITNIFISSGLGTRNLGLRFMNRPSFNLYRLKSL